MPGWLAWSHVLIFAGSLLISVFGFFTLISFIHGLLHQGEPLSRASATAQKFVFIPIIVGMFGPTFAIANFLEWAIRPIRDSWDRHFEGVRGTSLREALRVTYWLLGVTALSLVVSLVGAIDPWQR